jgi:hypothetical protein
MRNWGLNSRRGEESNKILLICIMARKNCPWHWTTVAAASPMERRALNVKSMKSEDKPGSVDDVA